MFVEEILPVMLRRPLWLSFLVFIFSCLAIEVLKRTLFSWLEVLSKKTSTQFDDTIVLYLKKNLVPVLYTMPFYFSLKVVLRHQNLERFLDTFGALILVFFGVRFLVLVVSYSIEYYLLATNRDIKRVQNFKAFATVIKIFLWVVASLLVLDNLGFKITSIVAGLGVGGVAFALAAQATLGDFFSYLIIIFDRPFEVGHMIVCGDLTGNVESIGIKTTRIRALNGELAIVPNSALTSKTLLNHFTINRRRSLSTIAIAAQTELEKLNLVPQILQKAVESVPGSQFDRANLTVMNENSYNFELNFFAVDADYKEFLKMQQQVFYQIVAALKAHEIKRADAIPQILIAKSRPNN